MASAKEGWGRGLGSVLLLTWLADEGMRAVVSRISASTMSRKESKAPLHAHHKRYNSFEKMELATHERW